MASESGSQPTNQFRIQSPRPTHRSSPYPPNPLIPSNSSAIECLLAPPQSSRVTGIPSADDRARSQSQIPMSVWDRIQEQQMDFRLERLLPVHEACYNAALPTTFTKRIACTENTRVDLLNGAWAWTRNEDGAKIYWLNGMAGTGKTTIAYTMCKMLQEDKRLGASFFCSRNSPDCRDVNKIVPTIAYQLGRYLREYRIILCHVLDEDPDVARRDIGTQFKDLISKPLATIGGAVLDNVVIVIDALDECTDVRGTKSVLEMLMQDTTHLPLKFLVASRPEPDISDLMTASNGAMRSILWLHDIEKSIVKADIKTYLVEALRSVHITPSEIEALVERAGCLFIFAATAVRYIVPDSGPVNHRQRLLTVLELRPTPGNKSYEYIDDLYATILAKALDENIFEKGELALRRQLLWSVVCIKETLTKAALAELLSMWDIREAELAIQPLQSVLHVSETTDVVSALHASFPDFLLDKERAGQFYCDKVAQSIFLAECCFKLMDRSLRFNICGLESSYMRDQDVPDFKLRVDKAISIALYYSCRYWGDHLTDSGSYASSLLALLDHFMRKDFLSWMEVLNLKETIGHGDDVLGKALAWCSTRSARIDLHDFIYDARAFLVTFASNPTSLSTPHLYISALPFTPKKSHIWATYWPRTQGLIRIEGSAIEERRQSALATWVVGNSVNCIAQSSDGKRVVSGSGNWLEATSGRVSVWDTSSGTCIIGPLKGHKRWVTSVSLSPDDTRIASGSSDRTIRIWDATTGGILAGPLRGHVSDICSLAFSLDGARLVSGSDDGTIRIWDAYLGTLLGEPIKERQGGLWSVAFSPDGKHLSFGSFDGKIRIWELLKHTLAKVLSDSRSGEVRSIAYSRDNLRIASGSKDCTVRVWDVSTGTLLVGPLEGHSGTVSSVLFSFSGNYLASGSHDTTVRVWEVESGKLIAGPLEGHRKPINSVLFTADDTRILSGSDDGTIRVWDARHKAKSTPGPLGHNDAITSVAVSPDGTCIASGSKDRTIYVWNTHNGALISGPFQGHTGPVNSVAFSPEGARLVSGSSDCTLRVWDACTGALLASPFQGHNNSITSVIFSPDGSRIASSSDDKSIRIWNSQTSTQVFRPFKGHTRPVTSIAFSLDGACLVSGSHDTTVRIVVA